MAKPRVVNVQFNNEQIVFGDYTNHILAEGDSWFGWAHLNLNPSSNLLEELRLDAPTVVVSYAYSGDTVRNMADQASNAALALEIRSQPYQAIMLSGGGNDLIDALPNIIRACDPAAPPASADACIDRAAMDLLFDDFVIPNYRQIIAHRNDRLAPNRNTPVIIHTYDTPTSRPAPATLAGAIPAAGPWLWKALRAAHVPQALDKDIVDAVFGRLRSALLSLHDPAANIHVVDTSGTIERAEPQDTGLSGDWINEIHPDAHGYALLAQKLSAQLKSLGLK
jgi:lysophospholipase L1-like esterase